MSHSTLVSLRLASPFEWWSPSVLRKCDPFLLTEFQLHKGNHPFSPQHLPLDDTRGIHLLVLISPTDDWADVYYPARDWRPSVVLFCIFWKRHFIKDLCLQVKFTFPGAGWCAPGGNAGPILGWMGSSDLTSPISRVLWRWPTSP